jgi:uncharacterized protein
MSDDWPRPVVHWELVAKDPSALADFYRQMFNWDITDGAIMSVAAGLGGPEPGPAGHLRRGDRPGFTIYVQVRDLTTSLRLAAQLGGQAVTEPFDAPGGPTLALIRDPEGNDVMLVQQ